MLLSIIVPVYNVEKYLKECLDSLLNQKIDYNKYEIILVNDGSSDSSREICESYISNYSNVRLINQANQGLSQARNVGIEASKGKYLYFIDSDDLLSLRIMSDIIDVMENEYLSFLGFQIIRSKERNIISNDNFKMDRLFEGSGIEIIENYNFNNGVWWYVFKKEILNEIRFIKDIYCEDGIFTSELLLNVDKGLIISNKLYNYYFNEESIVNSKKNLDKNFKIINDMFYVVKKFDRLLTNYSIEKPETYLILRKRQETYVYFAIIRSLKFKLTFHDLNLKLNELNFKRYKAYPIKTFRGYNIRDKFLITLFNNRFILYLLVKFNNFFR